MGIDGEGPGEDGATWKAPDANSGVRPDRLEEVRLDIAYFINQIRTGARGSSERNLLPMFNPDRYDENPSDPERRSRAEATLIQKELIKYFASDEHQARVRERENASAEADRLRKEKEARESEEAGAVVEAMLQQLTRSGVENAAENNPEAVRKLLEALFGLRRRDKDEDEDFTNIGDILGRVFKKKKNPIDE